MVDDRYRRRDEHDYGRDHERGNYRDFHEDRERYGAAGHANESTNYGDYDHRRGGGFARDDERNYRRGGYGRNPVGGHGPGEDAERPHSGYGRGGYNRADYGETVQAGGDLYGRDRYPGDSSREGYAGSGRSYGGERFGSGYGERFAGGYDDYGRDYGRDLESQAYGPNPRSAYRSSGRGSQSSSYGAFHPWPEDGAHRGRGPRGYQRSDERIREDVSDRLSDDGHVDASDIEVTVSKGEVTLNGTVSSRGQKRRAEDIAEDVSAVKHVQNNLRITPGANTSAAGGGTDMSGVSTSASGTALGTSGLGDTNPQASRKT